MINIANNSRAIDYGIHSSCSIKRTEGVSRIALRANVSIGANQTIRIYALGDAGQAALAHRVPVRAACAGCSGRTTYAIGVDCGAVELALQG